MGSLVEEIEGDRECDFEDVIFVAVGKNVEKSKTTLDWAVDNFPGKKICVLHVQRPTHVLALSEFFNFLARLNFDFWSFFSFC